MGVVGSEEVAQTRSLPTGAQYCCLKILHNCFISRQFGRQVTSAPKCAQTQN